MAAPEPARLALPIVGMGERRHRDPALLPQFRGLRGPSLALVALVAATTLAGCGSSGDDASTSATASSSTGAPATTVNVVASTNVYGDIVHQIAGDRVHVTSIISDPDADPHSYEANTQN